MVLTAYLDESGTHGDASPAVLMAGFIAKVEQWAEFEHRFSALLRENGVNVFHSKKFKAKKGPFQDWSVDRATSFLAKMTSIIEETVELGFGSVLNNDDYVKFYKSVQLPRKIRKDSQYGLAFRHLMFFGARYAADTGKQINFVLEAGHPNYGDAVRIFGEFKSHMEAYYPGVMGTISYDIKKCCVPLAAADFLAHSAFMVTTSPDPASFEGKETYFLGQNVADQLPAAFPGESFRLVKVLIGEREISEMIRRQKEKYERRIEWGRRKIGQ